MKEDINNLIFKYSQIVHNHRIPIDMTNYEQNGSDVDGTVYTLNNVINDLIEVLRNNEDVEKDNLLYTE